jgi:hypothetical protein
VFIDHYHWHRAHRSLNLTPPDGSLATEVRIHSEIPTVIRTDRLGGLLHEYRLPRKAQRICAPHSVLSEQFWTPIRAIHGVTSIGVQRNRCSARHQHQHRAAAHPGDLREAARELAARCRRHARTRLTVSSARWLDREDGPGATRRLRAARASRFLCLSGTPSKSDREPDR